MTALARQIEQPQPFIQPQKQSWPTKIARSQDESATYAYSIRLRAEFLASACNKVEAFLEAHAEPSMIVAVYESDSISIAFRCSAQGAEELKEILTPEEQRKMKQRFGGPYYLQPAAQS